MRDRPIRVKIGAADFRRLCAGQPVRIVSLAERPIEILLDDIGVVPALKAVLDGMTRGEHERGMEERRDA